MATKARKKRGQQEEHHHCVPTKRQHLDTETCSEVNSQATNTPVTPSSTHTTECSSHAVEASKSLLLSDCGSTDSPKVVLTPAGTEDGDHSGHSVTKMPSASVAVTSAKSTSDKSDIALTVQSSPKAGAIQDNAGTMVTTSVTAGSLRLHRNFYNVPAEDLAKVLLGKKIVRIVDGVRISAKIVETEAYLGAIDKAAHSYKRQTERNKAMFMQPGTAYVYNIYGMYCCLNISSHGDGCAVLIRSVEPTEGVQKMGELRRHSMKTSSPAKHLKDRDLGNGPSKLCQALGVTKAALDQQDLVNNSEIWLEQGDTVAADSVVVSARINIGYAEDWTDKPLRFYTLGSPFVSVRDKAAEKKMESTNLSVLLLKKT